MLSPVVDDQLVRAEAGYCLATALLCSLLVVVYRRGGRPAPARGPAGVAYPT